MKQTKVKRIGIIGSRRRNTSADYDEIKKIFFKLYNEGDMIVSGGCPIGGDRFAERIAENNDIPIAVFKPRWKKYKRSAGFKRNTYIAKHSTHLIACVAKDRTGGTEDTICKFNEFHPRNEIILC